MSVSGALFDLVKLLDISKTVISKYTAKEVYEEALKWAKEYDVQLQNLLQKDEQYTLKILSIERGKEKPRRDISKWSDLKENIQYMYKEEFEKENSEYQLQKIDNRQEAKNIISSYLEKYYNHEDEKETWFGKIKELAHEYNYAKEVKEYKANPEQYKGHVGDISTLIRIALTKRSNTPDMYEIMQVLGKEEVQKRLQTAIKNL